MSLRFGEQKRSKVSFNGLTDTYMIESSPLIIGGTGGSGTRVVASVCIALGANLGRRRNNSLDCLDFVDLHNRWIPPTLKLNRGNPFPPLAPEGFTQELRTIIGKLYHETDGAPIWGWKAPRSVLLLPALLAACGGMRYIHVVRDGRDMATSRNQNQPRRHGVDLLGSLSEDLSAEELAILVWKVANLRARELCTSLLAERYLCVRYEDLCDTPLQVIETIAGFLGAQIEDPEKLQSMVSPPSSLGRWRQSELSKRCEMLAEDGLREFGYLSSLTKIGGTRRQRD